MSAACGGALLCIAPLLVGGCKSVDAKVWNLRQVHDSEGGTKRVGSLRTDFQQLVIGSMNVVDGRRMDLFGVQDEKEKPIEDPDRVSLENLLELAGFDSSDPRVFALQVEMFGWLAVDDRYVLARERSLLELGPLGRELGAVIPVRLSPDQTPADADAVGAALQNLAETVAPAVRGVAPVAKADIEEACAAIDALVLNRAGLRRLISALTVLLYNGSAGPDQLGILPELHHDLQREFVAQTLAESLSDPHPLVRAAAIEAATISSENTLPGLLQGALINDETEVVRLRCLRMLELHGIPRWTEDLSSDEEQAYREDWIRLLVQLLRGSMEGPVSAGACRSLERISGADFATLRPEAWVEWWDARQDGGSP